MIMLSYKIIVVKLTLGNTCLLLCLLPTGKMIGMPRLRKNYFDARSIIFMIFYKNVSRETIHLIIIFIVWIIVQLRDILVDISTVWLVMLVRVGVYWQKRGGRTFVRYHVALTLRTITLIIIINHIPITSIYIIISPVLLLSVSSHQIIIIYNIQIRTIHIILSIHITTLTIRPIIIYHIITTHHNAHI